MEWLGGHPYLIHVALYEIASENYSYKEFIRKSSKDNGPYSDHLRRHLWNLSKISDYKKAMKQIIQKNTCTDTISCHKLRAAGLIKGAMPNIEPRFRIYEEYMKDKL